MKKKKVSKQIKSNEIAAYIRTSMAKLNETNQMKMCEWMQMSMHDEMHGQFFFLLSFCFFFVQMKSFKINEMIFMLIRPWNDGQKFKMNHTVEESPTLNDRH